ncbi:MAG: hypothetical protein U9Q99_03190 [Nanoarchaeota archaeon]|nr:hypothetical protein [Nanoarchaeota archaeon]
MKEIKEMFGDKKNISFSEAYKNCVGECMEKLLATFLLLRNSKDLDNQLIINGSATDNIDLGVEMHSYNMIKKKMKGIY